MGVHRLSALARQGPTLIDYLMGQAVDRLATFAEKALIRHGELTGEQARAYIAALQALRPIELPVDLYDRGERLFALDFISSVARDGLDRTLRRREFEKPKEHFVLPDVELDFNWWLREQNRMMDEVVLAGRKQTFRQRKASFEKLQTEPPEAVAQVMRQVESRRLERQRFKILIENVGTGDKRKLTRAVANLLWHGWDLRDESFFQVADEVRMERSLVLVGMALAAYRAERGEYPAALSDLSPAYLKAVPPDIFTDKPLKYRRVGAGCIVYSLGSDMKDDGGKQDNGLGPDLVVEVKR